MGGPTVVPEIIDLPALARRIKAETGVTVNLAEFGGDTAYFSSDDGETWEEVKKAIRKAKGKLENRRRMKRNEG